MTTTGTSTRSREAQAYLDGVGAALADLPEEERADLLDELAAHLDELTAEDMSPLESRLGSPQGHAAELRASAGLPPAGARGRAGGYHYVVDRVPPRHGVWESGHRVRNVYVYDAAGNPLTDIRLFDHRGHAIALGLVHEGDRRQVLDVPPLLDVPTESPAPTPTTTTTSTASPSPSGGKR